MSDTDTAKRAVACKHWRYAPGVITNVGVVVSAGQHGIVIYRDGTCDSLRLPSPEVLPRLDAGPTMGHLLALVREAWGDPLMFADCCAAGWFAESGGDTPRSFPIVDTEAEALVAALEAAP